MSLSPHLQACTGGIGPWRGLGSSTNIAKGSPNNIA